MRCALGADYGRAPPRAEPTIGRMPGPPRSARPLAARPAKGPRMTPASSLDDRELALLDAYWRAANYLSVGQIYLLDNPLLREPLGAEHTKPRLLGHWGTTPGLNFLYAHMNRAIRARDLDAIFVTGLG